VGIPTDPVVYGNRWFFLIYLLRLPACPENQLIVGLGDPCDPGVDDFDGVYPCHRFYTLVDDHMSGACFDAWNNYDSSVCGYDGGYVFDNIPFRNSDAESKNRSNKGDVGDDYI